MRHVFGNRDTLLLDMDGTLLDLAYDNFFWQEMVPKAFADANRLPDDAAREQVASRIAREEGTLNWYCLDFWSDALSLDIMSLKRECKDRIAFLEGAEGFLERAKASGYRLVLVTNSTRALLELKDTHTGVTDYMDEVYSSHDFRAPKESQAFWQRFAQSSGISRESCVLIDDSASVLRAAEVFGLGSTIGLTHPDSRRPARPVPAHHVVDRVASLLTED
ncbi:MAG: HAD-IA family hydrolase [Pseudomonadota bacterium]